MCFGKMNVGKLDGMLRVILGAAFLAAGVLYFTALLQVVSLLVAAILLITGFTRSCPAYGVLGINTCGGKECAPAARKAGRKASRKAKPKGKRGKKRRK